MRIFRICNKDSIFLQRNAVQRLKKTDASVGLRCLEARLRHLTLLAFQGKTSVQTFRLPRHRERSVAIHRR